MNKLFQIVILIILVYVVFSTIPYMIPTLPSGIYLPYELWLFVLIIFYALLPTKIGTYVYRLRLENK